MWLRDITYITLKEGTLYLSIFIDICTRKIVGWSMSPRMKGQLVVDSFLQAFEKEQPGPGVIIHTD
ncbi:DDE-type integrase/transposase/recombinase [Enterococcus mundtii]|uniref:DDE-type integrase/transposase/recombinase n=1 Tax=Enterococcus mundtii TaxID=53346 RepID=A0A848MWK0_ENTMU|nr:DDE-type integrase/transposase/recombinase [Enterococcus mundtii]